MLQSSPMYSYIPAKDIARARRFYETTLWNRAAVLSPATSTGSHAAPAGSSSYLTFYRDLSVSLSKPRGHSQHDSVAIGAKRFDFAAVF
jgi:hypothetical protein